MVEQKSLKKTHPYPLWMFSPRSERVLYPHSPEQTNYCIDIIQKEVLYVRNHNKAHGRSCIARKIEIVKEFVCVIIERFVLTYYLSSRGFFWSSGAV